MSPMKNWKLPLVFALLMSATWLACYKDTIVPYEGPTVLVRFAGRVVDSNDQPVADAKVRAGTAETTTDANGVFSLPEQRLPPDDAILHVQHSGYFEFSRAFIVENKSFHNLNIQLLEKQLVHSFQSGQSSTAQTAGVQINFPANSVARADGSAYSGTVSVFAQYLDPTASDLNDYMPGDLRGITTGGEEQTLATYGMIGIELTTPSGEALNIAPGQEVEISMPIPAEKLVTAPATIPLWYYDTEKARWIEEGTAQKVGDQYVGKVAHFSFWNCDDPFPIVQLNGKLYLRDNESPLQWAQITLTILSNGWQGYGYTDQNGCYSGKIPVGEALLMEVFIQTPCGKELMYSQVIGPFQQDVTLPGIVIQPANLPILEISGRLLDCNQQPVSNGYASLKLGNHYYQAFTEPDGMFNLTSTNCPGIDLTVTGYDLNALASSTPAVFTNLVSPFSVGDIQVCTTLSEYIEIVFDGQTILFVENIKRDIDNLNTFLSAGIDQRVWIQFQNQMQTGTFPVNEFYMFPMADSLFNINMNTTISQFGPQGQQIIGTINGTGQSWNGQNHTVSGKYRVNY